MNRAMDEIPAQHDTSPATASYAKSRSAKCYLHFKNQTVTVTRPATIRVTVTAC